MRPSSSRPAFFLFVPPHCLKKNGTPARAALVADRRRPTPRSIGRAPGPDSPPTITQSMPVEVERAAAGPSSGSSERNRTARRTFAQVVDAADGSRAFSTLTPIQTFAGHGELRRQLRQPLGPLRQHLEACASGRSAHDVEHALDELVGHVLVEEVAHRVDEDASAASSSASGSSSIWAASVSSKPFR